MTPHEVLTVTERGWSGIENGELLALAGREFDVFLTADQNLEFQQNLTSNKLGIILMVARNNSLKALAPLIPEVRKTLGRIKKGEFVYVREE